MTNFAASNNADAFSQLRSQAAASGVVLGTLSDVAATALTVANLAGSFRALSITDTGTHQNVTATAAQLLTGITIQKGATGASTFVLPSGTDLDTALPNAAVGTAFTLIFLSVTSGQTITITGVTGTTVLGTAAVATGLVALLTFVRTGTGTWNVYCLVSA